ncbi:hypothetical protein DPMN_042036, partial [Dreissena polymorpha]
GIDYVLRSVVFSVVPTILEVLMVTGLLWYKCGAEFAEVTMGCITTYTIFTLVVTQWRTKIRVQMNQAEGEAGNKAIDSLINYETVKCGISVVDWGISVVDWGISVVDWGISVVDVHLSCRYNDSGGSGDG